MSLISLLDIGKKGIMTHQTSINVAGHNIANVNTPGYSRQEAVLSTALPHLTGSGSIGTGVDVQTVRRSYDSFVDGQLAFETSTFGRLDSKESALRKVELLFSDSTGIGLNSDISDFFNALHDLANNPQGDAERIALKSRGDILAGSFNSLSFNLEEIRKGLDGEIKMHVEEINVITSRIAQLNESIISVENESVVANDFRDERTQLIRELSEKVDINYFEGDDGVISIQGKGGFFLVNRNRSYELTTQTNADGHVDVYSVNEGGGTTNITTGINGGRIGGLLDARDTAIPGYIGEVDQLAYSITSEVNSQHQLGYALDGATTGLDFFADLSGLPSPPEGAAASMGVSTDITDVKNIAAAGNPDSPGDNTNALALADIQRKLTMGGPPSTSTFDDYYSSIVADVGIDVRKAAAQLSHQESLIHQLDVRRESVSGVSLDEEMADLVRFQHAFEASARLISVADEMLDTIMGLVR